jgi:hypothetical protein
MLLAITGVCSYGVGVHRDPRPYFKTLPEDMFLTGRYSINSPIIRSIFTRGSFCIVSCLPSPVVAYFFRLPLHKMGVPVHGVCRSNQPSKFWMFRSIPDEQQRFSHCLYLPGPGGLCGSSWLRLEVLQWTNVIMHSVQIMAVTVARRQSISSCPIRLKNSSIEPY